MKGDRLLAQHYLLATLALADTLALAGSARGAGDARLVTLAAPSAGVTRIIKKVRQGRTQLARRRLDLRT
jgi:hypothetical protein